MSSNFIIGVVSSVVAGVTAGCYLLRRWTWSPQEEEINSQLPSEGVIVNTTVNIIRTDNVTIVGEYITVRIDQQEQENTQEQTENVAEKEKKDKVIKELKSFDIKNLHKVEFPAKKPIASTPEDPKSTNKPVVSSTPADSKPTNKPAVALTPADHKPTNKPATTPADSKPTYKSVVSSTPANVKQTNKSAVASTPVDHKPTNKTATTPANHKATTDKKIEEPFAKKLKLDTNSTTSPIGLKAAIKPDSKVEKTSEKPKTSLITDRPLVAPFEKSVTKPQVALLAVKDAPKVKTEAVTPIKPKPLAIKDAAKTKTEGVTTTKPKPLVIKDAAKTKTEAVTPTKPKPLVIKDAAKTKTEAVTSTKPKPLASKDAPKTKTEGTIKLKPEVVALPTKPKYVSPSENTKTKPETTKKVEKTTTKKTKESFEKAAAELRMIDPDLFEGLEEDTFQTSITVSTDNLSELKNSNENDQVSISFDVQTSMASVSDHPLEVHLMGPVDSVVNASFQVDEVPTSPDVAKPLITKANAPTKAAKPTEPQVTTKPLITKTDVPTKPQAPTESKETLKKQQSNMIKNTVHQSEVKKPAFVQQQRPTIHPSPPLAQANNIHQKDSNLPNKGLKNQEVKMTPVANEEQLETEDDALEISELVFTSVSISQDENITVSTDNTNDPKPGENQELTCKQRRDRKRKATIFDRKHHGPNSSSDASGDEF